MANQIHLKGDFRRIEKVASATITPGMLVAVDSSDEVAAHGTEGYYAERMFAVEDALQGLPIGTNYTDGDRVSINVVPPGAVVNAFICAGEDVAIGDLLISNADGTLIELSSATSGVTIYQVIGVAIEANDLTASGAVNTRSAVRIL